MMLFEFALRELEAIQPWGTPPEQSLSWFGLTDGFYRLNVGTERLFEYSAVAGRRLLLKYPDAIVDRIDYQVARLWEDICEILPDVLNPISEEFVRLLSGPSPSVREWGSGMWRRYELLSDEEAEARHAAFQHATMWLDRRFLDSGYLTAAPHIWFWSTPDIVGISWDNRDRDIEGVHAWSAVHGSFTLPRETFLAEVREFNDRLIGQMAARVDEVCRRGPISGVQIDFDALRYEHAQRANTLDDALARQSADSDWQSVLQAVEQVQTWAEGTSAS